MHRSIQIKLISTEEIKVNKKSVKENVYIIINTDSNKNHTSKKLEMGSNNAGHQCKNDNVLELDLPMHVGFISVEVYYYKGKNYDNSKFVGAARIPVSDFLNSFIMPDDYVHFLSYRLRDVNGVRNGVINLSIKVSSSGYVPKAVSATAMPELGVPVCDGKGVVTGVPVNWYAQPSNTYKMRW